MIGLLNVQEKQLLTTGLTAALMRVIHAKRSLEESNLRFPIKST